MKATKPVSAVSTPPATRIADGARIAPVSEPNQLSNALAPVSMIPAAIAQNPPRPLRRPYTPGMPGELFEDMKRYIGFGKADSDALRALLIPLTPVFPSVIDKFYDAILAHPNARAVFAGNEGQMVRLKVSLLKWLNELFSGPYDEVYFDNHCRIGRVHVQVELPQHYMFTAMTVVRLALLDQLGKVVSPDLLAAKTTSLHKLLDLELAIMNQTYREDLVKRMQQLERAEYEARISESEHLATIGQLAASLAHEIKNPLAGISGAIQVLGAAMDNNHPHKQVIVEALRQIDRLDAAVKDLLIYARPKPPERAVHDLGRIIEHCLMMLREEPSLRTVKVHYDGAGRGHIVHVDEAQVEQVLTNLFLNAAHACEDGGEIFCRVTQSPLSEGEGRGEGKNVTRIVVEDTGCGISPHQLAKVLEPFYTTKARGTGLGLSICKRIVDSHGGDLKIESQVGRGTRVTVELASP
jgi:two-component system, NtrC family, sensor histidine kinase HydH